MTEHYPIITRMPPHGGSSPRTDYAIISSPVTLYPSNSYVHGSLSVLDQCYASQKFYENVTMSKENKRQRLTFKQKCELVEEAKSGASKQSILQKYGINATTYKRLIASESDLNNKVTNYAYQKKKSSKTSENMVLDAAVIEWVKQARDRGDPISGPIIQEQALILNEKLDGPQTFKASNGWLYKFKKRYCIWNTQMKEEILSNDPSSAAECSQTLKAKIESENLNLDNIYNASESGILWRLLMACTLSLLEEEEASGREECKDRVTALFCANATGNNRIPLLVIGKSKSPRCLSSAINKTSKNLRLKNLESLGVIYTYQNNAWMDKCIFMLWYKDEFIPRVLKYQRTSKITGKVVLLLDNAPYHPSLDELNAINENFEVVYLPLNVTALIQPMDQGLIATTKKLYKKSLLRHLLLSEKPEGAIKFLKELNLRDCFDMLSLAWDSVKSATLQEAWKPLLGDSFVLNKAPASANIQDPLCIDDASANIQDRLSNVDAVVNEPESPADSLSFPYEMCDQVCKLLSGPDYSAGKSREFLLKWFENDHNDNDYGWDSLSDSDVNFVTNIKCEPDIVTEIEKSESIFENPESMKVTPSKAFGGTETS